MNKARRKRINAVLEQLAGCRAELADIHAEEQEAYDSLPESIRAADRGEESECAIYSLEDAITSLEEIYGCHRPKTTASTTLPAPAVCSVVDTDSIASGTLPLAVIH